MAVLYYDELLLLLLFSRGINHYVAQYLLLF